MSTPELSLPAGLEDLADAEARQLLQRATTSVGRCSQCRERFGDQRLSAVVIANPRRVGALFFHADCQPPLLSDSLEDFVGAGTMTRRHRLLANRATLLNEDGVTETAFAWLVVRPSLEFVALGHEEEAGWVDLQLDTYLKSGYVRGRQPSPSERREAALTCHVAGDMLTVPQVDDFDIASDSAPDPFLTSLLEQGGMHVLISNAWNPTDNQGSLIVDILHTRNFATAWYNLVPSPSANLP